MLIFCLFKFSYNLQVGCCLFKVLSSYLTDIIKLRISILSGSLDLQTQILELLLYLLVLLANFLSTTLQIVLLVSDLHNFTRSSFKILLKLLELTTLLEKSLGCSSALVFKNLLTLKICTFSSLHKLITVIFVSHFKMIQSVCQRFYFFFTLTNFAIKLVSISL